MVNCEIEIGKNPSYTKSEVSAGLMLFFAECHLADFVTGEERERVPFVFLPLSGQLIYPR